MATIQSLNPPASTIVVGREGEYVTLQITFSNGTRKTARVDVGQVSDLIHGKLEGEAIIVRRSTYHPLGKQRKIDVLRLWFAGEGADLAVVSRATFLRAAKAR